MKQPPLKAGEAETPTKPPEKTTPAPQLGRTHATTLCELNSNQDENLSIFFNFWSLNRFSLNNFKHF